MMNLQNLLALAKTHATASKNISAQVCIDDAVRLMGTAREEYARSRLLTSLKYSVGILHADYQLAAAESFEVYNTHDSTTLDLL